MTESGPLQAAEHAIPTGELDLRDFGVDEVTGFAPRVDPVARLPSAFDPWEDIAEQVPALIRSRRLRRHLSRLPTIDPLQLTSPGDRERALLLMTIFVNGWMWGDDNVDLVIPASFGPSAHAISSALCRPPVVHYASMALNNWVRLDLAEPVSADNATMHVRMQGGTDEDWFFVASLGVELASAPLIRGLVRAHAHALYGTDLELGAALRMVAEAQIPVTAALERVRQWCTPEVFYGQLRRYMTGPPGPGLRFEGIDAAPQTYVGGSAGQSSVVQAIDATLGVVHGKSPTGHYLRMIRGYMPPAHRRLVEVLEATSRVRARVLRSTDLPLRGAYNRAVELLTDFRLRHQQLALDYVIKPSNIAGGQRGTGGTSLESFLQGASDASVRSQVG